MALDDYVAPEVAVAVAVTAAVASPPVRKVVRRGIVYGLASLLVATDKIAATARDLAHNVREAANHPVNGSTGSKQADTSSHIITA